MTRRREAPSEPVENRRPPSTSVTVSCVPNCSRCGVHATPEEAALGDVPSRFVHVIGVVIRGDRAVVAQLTNDRHPHAIQTSSCARARQGFKRGWVETTSGNSNLDFIPTGDGKGTVGVWNQAPEFASAACFECLGRKETVPVKNGCVLTVFDGVPGDDLRPDEVPALRAWLDPAGIEHVLPKSPDYRPKLLIRAG